MSFTLKPNTISVLKNYGTKKPILLFFLIIFKYLLDFKV